MPYLHPVADWLWQGWRGDRRGGQGRGGGRERTREGSGSGAIGQQRCLSSCQRRREEKGGQDWRPRSSPSLLWASPRKGEQSKVGAESGLKDICPFAQVTCHRHGYFESKHRPLRPPRDSAIFPRSQVEVTKGMEQWKSAKRKGTNSN